MDPEFADLVPLFVEEARDRIERLADGRYAILDFKTGAPPTSKQVRIDATVWAAFLS